MVSAPEPTPESPEARAARAIERALRFLETLPIERGLPLPRVAAAVRATAAAPGAADRAARRFATFFDETLARLRTSGDSAASLLGREATEAIVRAVGELEPDEALVRAVFAERGAEALIASLLYDGIIEFMKKMNSLGDLVPGVALAKRLGGGLLGGLASSLGGPGLGDALEKRVSEQVKVFLQGFVKIALERGAAFVTAPANRQLFREARERIARRLLERPARDVLARLSDERARSIRDAVAKFLVERTAQLGAPGEVERLLGPIYRRFGAETAAALADRYALFRFAPAEIADMLAPAFALLEESAGPG